MKLLYPFDRADVAKLEAAKLGTATTAATPFGALPALLCPVEVYNAAQEFTTGLGAFEESEQLADYLLRRFRLRLVP